MGYWRPGAGGEGLDGQGEICGGKGCIVVGVFVFRTRGWRSEGFVREDEGE